MTQCILSVSFTPLTLFDRVDEDFEPLLVFFFLLLLLLLLGDDFFEEEEFFSVSDDLLDDFVEEFFVVAGVCLVLLEGVVLFDTCGVDETLVVLGTDLGVCGVLAAAGLFVPNKFLKLIAESV